MYLQEGEILSLWSTVKSSEPRRVPGTWKASATICWLLWVRKLRDLQRVTMTHLLRSLKSLDNCSIYSIFCRHVYFTRALPSISVIITHNYTHTHSYIYIYYCFLFFTSTSCWAITSKKSWIWCASYIIIAF